jgi:radical SAM protein with 4Fe4S-binding SPASM domain
MSSSLHLVVLEVTGRCNLSCSYCYRGKSSSVDLQDSSLVLDQLAEINPYLINISGGEPLLFDDVFILAKDLKKICTRLLLTTNGTLVNEYPKKYFQYFDYIQISLDGDKQIHDGLRGKNTFEKAVNAAKYLKEVTSVSFLCTVSSANYCQLNAFIQVAKDLDITPKIGRMCEFGSGNPAPINNPFAWKNVLDMAAEKKVLNDDPLNFWFNEKKKKLRKPNKIAGGCTAGIAAATISPELDVFPCVKLRIPAGNLKKLRLSEIWHNSPLLASLRDWRNLKGNCPNCEYVSICRGCRADAWARTGDYLAPDPLCWLNGREEQ